jgi:hypothetical protein
MDGFIRFFLPFLLDLVTQMTVLLQLSCHRKVSRLGFNFEYEVHNEAGLQTRAKFQFQSGSSFVAVAFVFVILKSA